MAYTLSAVTPNHKELIIQIEDGKIPSLTYLKGFSIFTIALMHLINLLPGIPSKISTLASIGGTGVHVFFLCSGIGLYLSYQKQKTNFTCFLKKRFLKIYFPYILVVIISFFIPWMYDGDDRVIALLSHLLLFKMFIPKYDQSFGTHFWFISTIIQLYLLFIPMCLIKQKLKNKALFFTVFLSISVLWWILCYITGLSSERIWNSFCLQYIWEFALGFLIAEVLYNEKVYRISNFLLFCISVLGITTQACMALFSDKLKIFNDIPALFGYTALALLFMNITFIEKAFLLLSSISYEYYLIHILVFTTVLRIIEPKSLLQQCILGFFSIVFAIIFAFIIHKFIVKFYTTIICRRKN